jgi:hypothetical protein
LNKTGGVVGAARMTPQDIVTAKRHMTEGKLKAREVAKMHGVSEPSGTFDGPPSSKSSVPGVETAIVRIVADSTQSRVCAYCR